MVFTCEICYQEVQDRMLMPNQSKGCACTGKICIQCFVHDWFQRIIPVEFIEPEPNSTNERGPITGNIDLHWPSKADLLTHLFDKFEDTHQDFDGTQQELDDAAEEYVKQHMMQGRACPFCGVFGIWQMGDEPHFNELGRLQLTAPVHKYAGVRP